MPARRDDVLDGAVTVLAAGGSRALTHRAAEAAAGAPAGSATNYFRTRDALLTAVLDHVLDAEMTFYRHHARSGDDVGALARDTATMVDQLVGPARARTTARLALGLEAIWHAPLRAAFTEGRAQWRGVVADRCGRLGVDSPEPVAEALLALVDGLVVDRLRDDSAGSVEDAVHALLTGALGTTGARPRAPRTTRR